MYFTCIQEFVVENSNFFNIFKSILLLRIKIILRWLQQLMQVEKHILYIYKHISIIIKLYHIKEKVI